nr:PREDICTED: keratin, type I cytoskeletal 20 [Rhinolophus sinicus]
MKQYDCTQDRRDSPCSSLKLLDAQGSQTGQGAAQAHEEIKEYYTVTIHAQEIAVQRPRRRGTIVDCAVNPKVRCQQTWSFFTVNSIKAQFLYHQETDSAPSGWKLQVLPPRIPKGFHSKKPLKPGSSSQSPPVSMNGQVYRKKAVQYRGMAPSVYGGAGGHGTRISVSSDMVNYGNDIAKGNLLFGNEKVAMQNLNDRLASYLEKVRSLEQANVTLEVQIKKWYETNAPSISRDYSAYYKQIQELQNQIKEAQQEKAKRILLIDNAKLAAEDFRLKYETERGLRLTVEADLQSLSKVTDDLTLSKTDLEIQIEELNKDLVLLKKEHQEEVDCLRKQLGNTVNVELKAAPGLNLSAIIDEMRQKYEVLATENLRKAKEEFELQTENLQQQVTINTEELKESEVQLKSLSRTYQTVDIDLKSQLSLKDSLESTLQATKARYSSQLAEKQAILNTLEAQLMQIRTEAEHQNGKYNDLLDIKTRLEQEIATYRRLLEGGDITTTEFQLSSVGEKEIKKTRVIKTVIQETVDGKVVSSEVQETKEDF